MTTFTEKSSIKGPLPNNWQKKGEINSDDVINAYVKGKNDGKNEFNKELRNKFQRNLHKAISVSENVYESVNQHGIHLSSIHLRAENLNNFSVLFVTNAGDFLSTKFKSAYSISRRIKEKAIAEDFYISFSFMPDSKNLNQDCLTADGYFLKYEEK